MTDPTTTPKREKLIRTCRHCKGDQECRAVTTGSKTHSCEYCILKSGVAVKSAFPVVPCQYCGGIGFHRLKEDRKDGKNQNNNNKGGRHGRR